MALAQLHSAARDREGAVEPPTFETPVDDAARPRFREPRLRFPVDWRDWIVPTLGRAAAAAGFVLLPQVEARIGDAALAAVSVATGAVAIGLALVVWYTAALVRRELVADAVSLLVLVPAAGVASGIELADARFGGRSLNFLAATLAILAIFCLCATLGSMGGSARGPVAQASALPAALVIAAVIGGASRFSAGSLWQGVSLAWMAAAVLTLAMGVIPPARRLYVPTLGYAAFAVSMLFIGLASGSGASIAGSTAALAVAATAFAGVVLIILGPGQAARMPSAPPPVTPTSR